MREKDKRGEELVFYTETAAEVVSWPRSSWQERMRMSCGISTMK